jgi:hypothetical protein
MTSIAKNDTSLGSATALSATTALHLYVCVLSGYCLGIGLVFAGTGNIQARGVLLKKLRLLQRYAHAATAGAVVIWFDCMCSVVP